MSCKAENQNTDSAVSVVRVAAYEDAPLREAVRRHFDALGVDGLLGPDTKVLLKPNLLMRRAPDTATTTHPALVKAVALELRARGVWQITLADSPGGPYTAALLSAVYRGCGMQQAAQECGIKLNLATGFREAAAPHADALCGHFNLIDPVAEADLIINLPKLKTHAMMTLSGAVKNLFGCVPGLQKPHLHSRFAETGPFAAMLVDLARTVRPALTIVDAVLAMEGDGPSSGTPRPVGLTLAARNVFALDAALCALTGLLPEEVPTVRTAVRLGLSPPGADGLDYLCDGRPQALEHFRRPAGQSVDFGRRLPGLLGAWLNRLLRPLPTVRGRQCVGCGKCAESCPRQVITLRGGRAIIDYSGCIRCYCCHEMCPVRAIVIRRAWLMKL